MLAVERHPAAPPAMVAALPQQDWRDYQDLSFNRYDAARIVPDDAASDGAAIRMNGNSSVWAMQFKLDKLPTTGRWDLYAAVRVDAAAGHDAALGLRVGSAPPMNVFNTATVGLLNDGRYHFVKVPGGPFAFSANHEKSIYIQPPNAGFVKYIYLDNLVAVRAGAAVSR
jgi:hypothetical protein